MESQVVATVAEFNAADLTLKGLKLMGLPTIVVSNFIQPFAFFSAVADGFNLPVCRLQAIQVTQVGLWGCAVR